MNSIVLICLISTITLVLFMSVYLTPYFSKKKIRQGKFDIMQFLNLFLSPLIFIPTLYFLKNIIVSTPDSGTLYLPKYATELVFLGLLYFFVLGNGIHSVSVVLSKHMKALKRHRVWEINEFFHNAFSHLLITVSAVLISFSYSVMEINHPLLIPLSSAEVAILVISGIITGIVLGIASVEGSIPSTMFYLTYLLSLALPFIFIRHSLDFRLFPFTTFVELVLISTGMTLSFYKYKKKNFDELVPHHFFDES